MPEIGEDDDFEFRYRAALKAELVKSGLVINYEEDRGSLDLGLHLRSRDADGRLRVTQVRVWMQAKGLHAQTYKAEEWATGKPVSVSRLRVADVLFWYSSPEPVYLVVYVECVNEFLAMDVRDIVDARGGLPFLTSLDKQKEMTLQVPVERTLAVALGRMPSHRSMRIDGPEFRGRPLGHNYDPLRCELRSPPANEYVQLVDSLLEVHRFHEELTEQLSSGLSVKRGKLHLTYEWVMQLFTEYGFDEGTDFRIEGAPCHAQGDVLVVVDPCGVGPSGLMQKLRHLAKEASADDIQKALVFTNIREDELIGSFVHWRQAMAPLECMPQSMGSLTFNVLTTTNLFMAMAPRLVFRTVNYWV